MSLATRSASYAPSTPIFHDRVEKHCPATAPAASNNLHDLEEEDLEDIDGTTLNHPPPDDSVSSGSDSDPGSDGVREEPVTPSKSTQTRLETRSQHRKSSPISSKGKRATKSNGFAAGAGALSFAADASSVRPRRISVAAEGSLYQMNPLEMLGALPKLEWCSDRILRQWKRQGFSYRGFMKYITNATEEIRLKHSWEEEYVYSKKRFGDKHFINVDQATEALPAVDHINWDPVGLYHKANLAQMALDIIYFSNGTNPESPLDIIDSLFPMPFAPYWEDDCGLPRETIREEIFRIGLEIRTQRFVRKAIALPRKKSPKSMLEETFNNASFGDAELRGWEMDGLQDEFGGITQEYHDRLEGRVRELRQSFRNDDSKLFDASALEASFPWSEFVVKLAEWIRQRIFQLDERSAAQENRDAAIAKLHAELQRRPNGTVRRRRMLRPESVLAQSSKPENTIMENIKSRAQHEPVGVPPPQRQLTPPVAPNKNFISIGSIRHILKLRERSRTAPSTTQRSHQQRPAQAEQVRETSVHRIISSQETVPSPDDEDLAGTEARATVVSSGVAFLQRQSNASRVSPIRSSRPLADKETPRVNKRKRPRSVDSDESEESAFQTDTRQIASISRRAKKPRLERVSQNSTVSSPRRGPLARPQVNHPAASHPPSSRLSSVQPRGSREPERKLRIFWTKEEDRQLIRLVRKYGPHWARIEYMDAEEEAPKLKARNQISIKDRARQLKFNYLKNKQPLPRNFKLVGLSQKMKDKLELLNIDHQNAEEEDEEAEDEAEEGSRRR